MTQQSNALRRLEETFAKAVTSGNRNQLSGPVLLEAMGLSAQPQNIINFYRLLIKAEEEAKSIKNKPNIKRYLQTIEELHRVFVVNHVWSVEWNTFAAHIEGTGVLNTLDALAEFFNSQNPTVFLEQDFLGKLDNEFQDILYQVLESNYLKS